MNALFSNLKKAVLRFPNYISGDDDLETERGIVVTTQLVLDRIKDDRESNNTTVLCKEGGPVSLAEYTDAVDLMSKADSGSFVSYLGRAWMHADGDNRVALEMAFSDLLCRFVRQVRAAKERI